MGAEFSSSKWVQSGSTAEFINGLDLNNTDLTGITLEASFSGDASGITGLDGSNGTSAGGSGGVDQNQNVLDYSIGSSSDGSNIDGIWNITYTGGVATSYPSDIILTTSASVGNVTDILLTQYDESHNRGQW